MKKFIFLMLVSFSLSGCVTPRPKLNLNDAQAVASAITVQRDDFKKITNYKGPNAATDYTDTVFIRAWKLDKGNEVSFQIYIADSYIGDWRFYNAAFDSNGKSLDTTLISRDVDSCSRYSCIHTEHVALNVSRDYLEKNKDTGISFKLSGRAGEEIFYITGAYVTAILNVVK